MDNNVWDPTTPNGPLRAMKLLVEIGENAELCDALFIDRDKFRNAVMRAEVVQSWTKLADPIAAGMSTMREQLWIEGPDGHPSTVTMGLRATPDKDNLVRELDEQGVTWEALLAEVDEFALPGMLPPFTELHGYPVTVSGKMRDTLKRTFPMKISVHSETVNSLYIYKALIEMYSNKFVCKKYHFDKKVFRNAARCGEITARWVLLSDADKRFPKPKRNKRGLYAVWTDRRTGKPLMLSLEANRSGDGRVDSEDEWQATERDCLETPPIVPPASLVKKIGFWPVVLTKDLQNMLRTRFSPN